MSVKINVPQAKQQVTTKRIDPATADPFALFPREFWAGFNRFKRDLKRSDPNFQRLYVLHLYKLWASDECLIVYSDTHKEADLQASGYFDDELSDRLERALANKWAQLKFEIPEFVKKAFGREDFGEDPVLPQKSPDQKLAEELEAINAELRQLSMSREAPVREELEKLHEEMRALRAAQQVPPAAPAAEVPLVDQIHVDDFWDDMPDLLHLGDPASSVASHRNGREEEALDIPVEVPLPQSLPQAPRRIVVQKTWRDRVPSWLRFS